jgi:hypothetical protein
MAKGGWLTHLVLALPPPSFPEIISGSLLVLHCEGILIKLILGASTTSSPLFNHFASSATVLMRSQPKCSMGMS